MLDRREKKPERIVRESFEEHKIVETLLEELSRTRPGDEQYDAKVTVLRESVEHHAKEEEDELFPEAERLFSGDELEQMGAQIEDRKEEIREGLARRPRRAARSATAKRRRGSSRRTAPRSRTSSSRVSRSRSTSRSRKRR